MSEHSDKWMRQARAYLEYQVSLGVKEVLLPPPKRGREARAPLDAVRAELGDCTRCPLSEKRRNVVFGEGNPFARLMFIGEGPGADEDRQGRPFVGRAGQLLTRMINAMTMDRTDVYIANVVKCRPPGNRDPEPEEIDTCFSFLEAQIEAIEPEVIVALGRVAAISLLGTSEPISKLRGRFHDRKGIPVMVIYHPSFLLRKENDRRWKAEVWADLKQVMARLQIAVPGAESRP